MKLLKNVPGLTPSVRIIRRLLGLTPDVLSIRKQVGLSPRIIQTYFSDTKIHKLHIGCQDHPMDGWLNGDIYPKHTQVIYLDATNPFPFADNQFSYVYSEHMIEHISFFDGQSMISECYRTMKPGGKIRIATPNLHFLMKLYLQQEKEVHGKYLNFSNRYFLDKHPVMPGRVINNFFRDWGHQYIHDRESLEYLLMQAGFSNIVFPEVGSSEDAVLQNLEKHGEEITEEFNKLETIIIEAVKP